MTPHAFAIGASVTYKPNGGDVPYRATVVSQEGHNPFGDPMYSVCMLEAVPGVNVPEHIGVKALFIPALAVGDMVKTHETPLALIDDAPSPAGDPLTELIEAATAAKNELAIAGRYAEAVCTRLEAALKAFPGAWGDVATPTDAAYLARFPEDQRATADRAYQDGFSDGANSEGDEDNAVQLLALIESGLTFGEVLNVFGEHQREKTPELTPYSEAVDSVLPDEASFDTDDTPIVSKGDDAGAYVLVWAWVSDEDAGLATAEDADAEPET